MISPPPIKPGDTIGITAPGRKVSPEIIQESLATFQSWGVHVRLATHLFSTNHSYLAGTDRERLSDFQELINDISVNAIICARGGYGSSRFIDQLDFSPLKANPKWIVGFSDVTALHLKLYSLGIESIHATMPVLFSKPDAIDSVASLQKILFGKGQPIEAAAHEKNRPGNTSGELIGGNLSLILDSLGTSSEPDMAGKILVIEEVDEYRYKIDRMMNQLKRSGKLASLAGLVVGHLTDITDTELSFGETAEAIILNAVRDYQFPVAFNFPTGHENPNLAWRHGHPASLYIGEEKSVLSEI